MLKKFAKTLKSLKEVKSKRKYTMFCHRNLSIVIFLLKLEN